MNKVSKRAKLTPKQVKRIRQLNDTCSQKDLAEKFKVSQSTISNLIRGKVYRMVA